MAWVILFLGLTFLGRAEPPRNLSDSLVAELRAGFTFAPSLLAEAGAAVAVEEEDPILHLETFKVSLPHSFFREAVEAGQHAAAAREAEKFSLLTGGRIFARRLGASELDLGFWPWLVPRNLALYKNQDILISVDLLRLKW